MRFKSIRIIGLVPAIATTTFAQDANSATGKEPIKTGQTILRIREAYVFGQDRAVPLTDDFDEEKADLICQDIRHGISLATPHGALPVRAPFVSGRQKIQALTVFRLLKDAPLNLTNRNASIPSEPQALDAGVAVIKARNGKVYKVRVAHLHGDPRVWNRRVRIEYAVIPQAEGGGFVQLPGQPRSLPLSQASNAKLQKFRSTARVPGSGFKSFMEGEYESISKLPAKLELENRSYVALSEPLDSLIVTNAHSGVLAEQGIEKKGKIQVRSYTAVLVDGDMHGTIDVGSYAYVHIRGNLTETINCDSYATVIVDGDILGSLAVKSYVTLLLRGKIPKPKTSLHVRGSCWSTFFFDSKHTQKELLSMPATRQITLHVRESDLASGSHKNIGGWQEVIVADDAWRRLAPRLNNNNQLVETKHKHSPCCAVTDCSRF